MGGEKKKMTRDEFLDQPAAPDESARWMRFAKCHNADMQKTGNGKAG